MIFETLYNNYEVILMLNPRLEEILKKIRDLSTDEIATLCNILVKYLLSNPADNKENDQTRNSGQKDVNILSAFDFWENEEDDIYNTFLSTR